MLIHSTQRKFNFTRGKKSQGVTTKIESIFKKLKIQKVHRSEVGGWKNLINAD